MPLFCKNVRFLQSYIAFGSYISCKQEVIFAYGKLYCSLCSQLRIKSACRGRHALQPQLTKGEYHVRRTYNSRSEYNCGSATISLFLGTRKTKPTTEVGFLYCLYYFILFYIIHKNVFPFSLIQRLKVAGGVLAERTDEVAGDRVAFIDVSANLAHPTLFLGRLRLGLHVGLIVGVSHCFNL